jgi:hypothetical protein
MHAMVLHMIAAALSGRGKTSLRRASQSSGPEAVALLLAGRTAHEVDAEVDASGRTALHHACWRGDIRNVELLLDFGCDVNRWSTGVHSYGKTPIFYATTRCRDEVVELLLSRGARVRILNNKGQSVLSLASSHLSADVVRMVAAAEAAEAAEAAAGKAWAEAAVRRPHQMRPAVRRDGWLDFLSSHPDGQEYGDLDPRFCPASAEDMVTDLAVNPTSRESRRRHGHLSSSHSLRWWPPARKPKRKRARHTTAPGLGRDVSASIGTGELALPDAPRQRGRAPPPIDPAESAAADEADLAAFHRAVSEYTSESLPSGRLSAGSSHTSKRAGCSSIPDAFWDDGGADE